MQFVAVISKSGKRLMPTSFYRARKLIDSGRATIYSYRPIFTIQLTDREDGDTQEIEYCCDTGYLHIGISIKSHQHEYVREQRDCLSDEVQKHEAQVRIRRARRNHLRYRKPRFDNRKRPEKWLSPSIAHKKDIHVRTYEQYCKVMPITSAFFEMGEFDTQLLKAIESGNPIPVGIDYQQGERYQTETLRNAVFARDDHTCQVCGRSFQENAILHVHHVGYLKHDHSNRMGNLLTVCEQCHTPANHKKGGKLYDLKPKIKDFKGATFMTAVRWQINDAVCAMEENSAVVHITYGAMTKARRHQYHIAKSHTNDAYVMGEFRPKHRSQEVILQKKRRNDRCLQKFYDAQYIDTRDGEKKSGQQLSNGRTKRGVYTENLRVYRGRKVSKGHVNIRRERKTVKPGSTVRYEGEELKVKCLHANQKSGPFIEFMTPASNGRKTSPFSKVEVVSISYNTGWSIKPVSA
jgi:hypothetical protein